MGRPKKVKEESGDLLDAAKNLLEKANEGNKRSRKTKKEVEEVKIEELKATEAVNIPQEINGMPVLRGNEEQIRTVIIQLPSREDLSGYKGMGISQEIIEAKVMQELRAEIHGRIVELYKD